MRLRIDLSYDGTDFSGWARQPALRTIQGELEAALATILRVPSVAVVCAGRTDAGVHARGQVVHLDVDEPVLAATASRVTFTPGRTPLTAFDGLRLRLNGVLPPDIRVRRVAAAAPGFDARFSATWRRYAYRVADEVADPLVRNHVLAWPRRLDLDAMNQASAPLLGEHDFAAFCKRREGATTVRALLDLAWTREGSGLVVATIKADAFCHNMVRALMGCLLAVGEGRREPSWAEALLQAGKRDSSVTVVPAHGLTLEEVSYPPDHELAVRADRTRNRRTLGATDA